MCALCDEEPEALRSEVISTEFRGKTISYEREYFYCARRNEQYTDIRVDDGNNRRFLDAYRKACGLLTGEEIINIRKRLGLSQRDLSMLLDMGAVTISRIERKSIQDRSTDDSIRRIKNDPLFLLEKLDAHKDKLGKKYERIKNLLDIRKEGLSYLKKVLEIYYRDSKDIQGKSRLSQDFSKLAGE